MIHLEPHQNEWKTAYESEKSNLIQLISPFNVCIEHIGSTAIPNIVAKPIIDIMIGVPNLLIADLFILEQIQNPRTSMWNLNMNEYIYRLDLERYMPERRFLQKYAFNGSRTHHIHLVKFNSDFWIRHLQFRNYLLIYPAIAKEYERLKIKLATAFSDTNLYAQAKTEFVQHIEQQACEYFKKH